MGDKDQHRLETQDYPEMRYVSDSVCFEPNTDV